jgi:mannose-1-phosphate guanylyltransferase
MYSAQHTYVAIMAGGVGSRFWPASREARPKQFLDILGVGQSLLQLTFGRFRQLCPETHIFIVTNARYQDLVLEQLPMLQPHQVLCEPSRNNTAPCVAYAALKIHALDPEANLVVAPSDHIILQEHQFLDNLRTALAFTSSNDALLTLGIRPVRPDTGYGYIQYAATSSTAAGGQEEAVHKVLRFTEKPPLEKAKAFLDSGDYLWNAGIFIWKAAHLLSAFQRYARDIYDILSPGMQVFNTELEQEFIEQNYPATPNISIDYAILEKADNVYTVPATFDWSDLGTWASLHEEAPKTTQHNALNADPALLYQVHNTLVRAPRGKMVVLRGLDNFIVVDEGDVLLIWPKDQEQEIKQMLQEIRSMGQEHLL